MTSLFKSSNTAFVSGPNEIVVMDRMEMKHLHAEGIRNDGCFEIVPCLACIRGVPELFGSCDEICAIGAIGVKIECSEPLIRNDLLPSVTFIS